MLGKRLSNLHEWLSGALQIGELRKPDEILSAVEQFIGIASESWDRDGGDSDRALAWAWECFIELGPGWADDPESLRKDFPVAADPAWELTELRLLVAFVLADRALAAFKKGTKKQMMLAAMLYADAVEARESWDHIRGPAGARNPNTWRGEIQRRSRALDYRSAVEAARPWIEREARSRNARRGAEIANAPKQAAKRHTRKLWDALSEREKVKRGIVLRFATDAAPKVPGTTVDGIRRWVAEWRKESSSR